MLVIFVTVSYTYMMLHVGPRQEHDSYRMFRSNGLNVNISLNAGVSVGFPDVTSTPSCLLYNSTMRWFDQLKVWHHYIELYILYIAFINYLCQGGYVVAFVCLSVSNFM